MNNPLDYEPHPLCIQACREVQEMLARREDWQEEIACGKMFGVLIVENVKTDADKPKWGYQTADDPKWGYLAAYSGQIGGRSDWEDFVPAVFDYLQPDGYFKTHEAEISHINLSISQLEKNERMKEARTLIRQLQEERKRTIAAYQEKMKEAKAKRDSRREAGNLSEAEEAEMIRESQFMKAELRRLKKSLSEKTALETEFEDYQENILRLKQLRKQLSDALQQWLFSQFRMLNQEGESKDLLEIFRDEALKEYPQAAIATSRIAALKMVPPAGSGECCEPKLLQYAYQHGYKPLQMAMFWWGESPKEEIRHHLQFYPACNGKCKPILHWMLPPSVFESPASAEYGIGGQEETFPKSAEMLYEQVETLYEDRELTVIHKPAGLLSVPGKDAAQPSVYALMRRKYPEATGPAHRPPAGHGDQRRDDHRQDRICLSSPTEGVSEPSGAEEIHRHHFRKRNFGKRHFGERHSGKGDSEKRDSEKGDSGKGNHLPSAATRLSEPPPPDCESRAGQGGHYGV